MCYCRLQIEPGASQSDPQAGPVAASVVLVVPPTGSIAPMVRNDSLQPGSASGAMANPIIEASVAIEISTTVASAAVLCSNEDGAVATSQCEECSVALCAACDATVHRIPKMRAHVRTLIK
jgi:hypothetical protein